MILNKEFLNKLPEIKIAKGESVEFSKQDYDIFISHSYLDKQSILKVKKIFEDSGYSVYIDWIEDSDVDVFVNRKVYHSSGRKVYHLFFK